MPYKNSIRAKEYYKKYYLKNIEKRKESHKKWREKNKEHRKEYLKKYDKNRTKEQKLKHYEARKKRLKKNPSEKIAGSIRTRIYLALKGKAKSSSSLKLTGCLNWEQVWEHLEKLFKSGMTRENHGLWHIDHIIPCSSFDLTKPEEQAKCFHYTNLQPLWASENLSKGNRIS